MEILFWDSIGSSFAITCTYLFSKMNRYGWPIALLSCITNFILFFKTQLYANTGLEIYFFISTLYGWYNWYQADQADQADQAHHTVQNPLSIKTWLKLLLATVLLALGIEHTLIQIHSTTPWLDSITCALSVIAQGLLAQRYLENWYFWLVADLTYLVLYVFKYLPFHAIIMCIYVCLAIQGLYTWGKKQAEYAV